MIHEQLSLKTTDGEMTVHAFTPVGDGPWPAVILYMDALAIRPALLEMAARLAADGHVVLLPDLFYRYGPYEALDPRAVFASGDFRGIIGPLMATTDTRKASEDTGYLLAYLDTRSDVTPMVGTTGYCMGGGIALAAAGAYPERIGAAASFHGGNLATDAATSPHLAAPTIEARVYIGAAQDDGSYPPEMEAKLKAAFDAAGVAYVHETYPAAHGWTMTDFPIYDEACAERHWQVLLDLFGEAL